jgi:hypothetical protein
LELEGEAKLRKSFEGDKCQLRIASSLKIAYAGLRN